MPPIKPHILAANATTGALLALLSSESRTLTYTRVDVLPGYTPDRVFQAKHLSILLDRSWLI